MRKQKLTPDIQAYFERMGRIGGLKGGLARSQKLSPERRREIAQKAVAARWAKQQTLTKNGPPS
jgi:hypothetical protein